MAVALFGSGTKVHYCPACGKQHDLTKEQFPVTVVCDRCGKPFDADDGYGPRATAGELIGYGILLCPVGLLLGLRYITRRRGRMLLLYALCSLFVLAVGLGVWGTFFKWAPLPSWLGL